MRTRLLRRLTAAAVALAVIVPGTAEPARASGPDTIAVSDLVNTALNAVQMLLSGGISSAEAIELVRQVINAVNAAESAVIVHIDAIAAAEIRGELMAHLIEFDDINSFEEETMEDWAQAVTLSASRATSYLSTLSDKKAIDDLGYALNTLYSIGLTARAKAGFGTTSLKANYRAANQVVMDRLEPSCETHNDDPRANPLIIRYVCTAYNGDNATATEIWQNGVRQGEAVNLDAVKVEAARNTSREVARLVLTRVTV